MDLVEAFELRVQFATPLIIGDTVFGHRMLVAASGGTIRGPRISGQVTPGGGDWVLTSPDEWARPDIRHTIKTDDGAVLYLQAHGVMEMNSPTQRAVNGGPPTDFDDAHLRLHFTFESGDHRYEWMTQTLFIGRGRIQPGPVAEYQTFQVA